MQLNLAVTHVPSQNCLIEILKFAIIAEGLLLLLFNHQNVFDL